MTNRLTPVGVDGGGFNSPIHELAESIGSSASHLSQM